MIVNIANTSAVAEALKSSSHDIGTLCCHVNINPWAKYKPVLSYKEDVDNTYWQGMDGKCGFAFTQCSNYTQLESAYNNKNEWKYDSLQNHHDAPKRIGDFRGYDSEASAPLRGVNFPSVVNNSDKDGAGFTLIIRSSSKSGELSLSDFPTLSEGYFGVYVYKKKGGVSARATCSKTISQGGSSVIITTKSFLEGEWRAVPFISANPIAQGDKDTDNSFITVPCTKYRDFVVESASKDVSAVVSATYQDDLIITWRGTSGGNKIINVEITILKSANTVFRNNEVQLRKQGNYNPNAPLFITEKKIKMDDWNYVSDNIASRKRFVKIKNLHESMLNGASIIVTLESGKYVFTTDVKKEFT